MKTRPRWQRLAALILTPLLVAGAILAVQGGLSSRAQRVEAAIVNLDEMVTIDGRPVPLGRQLAAELTSNDRQENFAWVLADEKTAATGLDSGRFAAVVTVPTNFSAAATSTTGEPGEARRATVSVTTSPRSALSESSLGQSLADASVTALNQELATVYLDNIYLGFSTMHGELGKAADGARQIADGQQELTSGLDEAGSGASQLDEGLGQLVGNNDQLNGGGDQLRTGSEQLATGLGELDAAVRDLPGSTQALASGAGELAAAAQAAAGAGGALAQGANGLSQGAGDLADGTTKLDAGVQQYVQGTKSYVTNANAALRVASAGQESLAPLVGGVDTLVGETADGAGSLADKAGPALKGASSALDGGDALASAAAATVQQVKTAQATATQLAKGDKTLSCPASLRDTAGACEAYAQGVRAGGQASGEALSKAPTAAVAEAAATVTKTNAAVRPGLTGVSDGVRKLAEATASAKKTWQDMRGQIPGADTSQGDQLDQLIAGGEQLLDSGPTLVSGSASLKRGGEQLRDGAGSLADGSHQLADGLGRLASGTHAVAEGTGALSSAAPTLAEGVADAARGGADMARGVQQYTVGITQYTDGVRQAGDGAKQLTEGLEQAGSGSAELGEGTRDLAGGLDEAVAGVPNYSEQERSTLSEVAASPIEIENAGGSEGTGLAALVMIAALWVGTLAAARAPQGSALVRSNVGSARILGATLAPVAAVGVTLGVLLGGVGGAVLGLHAVRVIGLMGLMAAAGFTFAVVNLALVMWLGPWGRVLSGAMWLIPTLPLLTRTVAGLVEPLLPASPASPALDAASAWATGQPVTGSVIALATWALVGLLLVAAWLHRRRATTARALMARAM